ncbi:MAG: hypothetical protein ABI833_12410 [Acidobacteriota bacterium]
MRLLPVVLALSFASTSCWFGKSPPPRVFVPPPPVVRPPVATVEPELPPPPEIDAPEDTAITEGIPAAMPPVAPAPPPPRRVPPPVRANTQPPEPPTTAPPETQPTPRLGQIFTAEQLRDYNRALEESLDRVRRVLGSVSGRNLNPELTQIVSRIQTFQKQAEQAREQDLVTAVNLARRADLLAQDLVKRLP